MMADSSTIAATLSLAGVVITGLLTAMTALRSGKDRMERNAARRQIEEETTDVILARTRRELDRVYGMLDARDMTIRELERWIRSNRDNFAQCGISVPDFDTPEASVREMVRQFRPVIDEEARKELEDRYNDQDPASA
jgi:hypothetical protein